MKKKKKNESKALEKPKKNLIKLIDIQKKANSF